MQYILTEQEYQDLRATQRTQIHLSKTKLQTLCTEIANTMPVSVKWVDNGVPQPWQCILTEKHEHYCDECPVQSICPNEHKEWSK